MQNNGQIRRILDADRIFIYGAGFMGKALKKCLTEAPFHKVISGFVVESRENNPDDIDGIPVMDVAEATIHRDELVLVALHEMHIANVMRVLQEQAFSNVMVMSFDSDLWSEIRGRWFRVNMPDSIFVNESLGEGEGKATDLSVYVVHSIYDRELAEKTELRSFEVPIRVGAALTDKKLFTVRDDTGENISEKNRQYCEWLFPILEYCEKQIGTKENGYQNRYLGFLAERMLTIYLTHNSHLRAAIVPKHFIECK